MNRTGLVVAVAGAACALASTVFAGSTADSAGTDWFGASSGWVREPTIPVVPGGVLTPEYKHWFEGAAPAAWSAHPGGNITLPAGPWPVWPFGVGATLPPVNSTDAHGCTAGSEWAWSGYKAPFLNWHYLTKYTRSTANAASVPGVVTAAHSRTQWVDPWSFTRPDNSEWTVAGGLSLSGELETILTSDYVIESFFDVWTEISFDNGPAQPFVNIHVGTLSGMPQVSVTTAPGVVLSRNGMDLTAADIAAELNSYFLSPTHWLLTGDPGPDGTGGYYFYMAYHLPSTVTNAEVFTYVRSGADDALPTPGTGAGVLVLAACVGRRRHR